MCGRYATTRSPSDLSAEFEAEPAEDLPELDPDYNVAPTKVVPLILERRSSEDPAAKHRLVKAVTWGLVPSWAKDRAIGNRLINARAETLAEKPSFRAAYAKRRALVPADGFYEWYASEKRDAKGRPVKQPFFIHAPDRSTLAMAGLYEIWRDRSLPEDDDTAWLWSFTIITTTATDDVGRIHDRAPMLVPRDRWATWLDPDTDDKDELARLLVPAAPGALQAYPVSREVNNVRNNGPQLVEPIALEDEPGAAEEGEQPTLGGL
ncbi:SOS response-associated peptidase [Mumia sp. zg.B17]|uniref:SOS response-associated peptidase n=1 Tax=unclassified Mumia TaxID=2621872 RepID=UPI001C6F526D|nr:MULTISPECIES: SOS response-associated peptidase [unclassified Mumia]MBW9206630.1 SOS response-associated peptidase [Mumia sp. zg.B17]MBW9211081.1 SOS response-associated peptidase [Mumia sp. zg.B21]MDD9347863.1 SOS response-associated peptidase [Mumia sp.]